MRLACSHCDRYDASPLSFIPSTWPDAGPIHKPLVLDNGVTVDALGVCPDCDLYRRTAFAVPVDEPEKEPQLSLWS